MSQDDDRLTPAEAAALAEGEEWPESMERDRGILTDIDRQFIWGTKTYDNKVTRSERRRTIRNRFEDGIRDLSYLTMLSERDRGKVVSSIQEAGSPGELRSAIANLISFLYLELDDVEWFEETVAHGISNAEGELLDGETTYYTGSSLGADVDVDIEVRRGYNVDEIEERLRAGEEHTLTPAEVGVLVREGRVDPDDLETLDFTRNGSLFPAADDDESTENE